MNKRQTIITTIAITVTVGSFGLMNWFSSMAEPPVEKVEPQVKKYVKTVKEVQADHNGGLQVEGIVVNQYQPRARLPQQIVEELRGEGLPIMDNRISASVKMRESHQLAQPLIHMAPRHKLTREFVALYEELDGQAA